MIMFCLQLVETLRSQHKKSSSHAKCHKALNFAIQVFWTCRIYMKIFLFWQTVLSKYDKFLKQKNVSHAGFEPATFPFQGERSNQLS